MRSALNVFVLGAVALLVGCSGESSGSLNGHAASSPITNGDAKGPATPAAATAAVAPAVSACSAVAAPTSLSAAKDASDLHIAGTAVFFQSGTSVNQVMKDGTGKAAIFTSPNLIHSYVDAKTFLSIEQTSADDPTATLRAFTATVGDGKLSDDGTPAPTAAFPTFPVQTDGDDPGGTTANTNFNAAGANVFAADDANLYLMADDGNGNTELIQVDRAALTQTVLLTSTKVISNPQIASGAIWYVQDNQRIFMIALATDDTPEGDPKEMFDIGSKQCNLAVTELNAFCSIGTEIDSRTLTGDGEKTLLATAQSKVSSPFGAATALKGTLFVRDAAPDADIKHTIRVLSTGATPSESLAACGREQVTGVAADDKNVAWTEDGVGVFITTR